MATYEFFVGDLAEIQFGGKVRALETSALKRLLGFGMLRWIRHEWTVESRRWHGEF